jgi:Zn-dependent protease/CBS domain-containing protein
MFSSGSIKLFETGGTAVKIHPTFFLLLIWVGVVNWLQGGAPEAARGIVFIAILFACVVLHEFGHILMARRFGIATPDITLLPIGGVASMERMPEKPGQEILVALAGPAVNVVIFLVLFILMGGSIDVTAVAGVERTPRDLLAQVAVANLVLVVFNLIPAFPMDGGRVLRALLVPRLGRARATRIAANIGQALAVLIGVLGLMGNPFLLLIAVFIYLAASGEAGYAQMQDVTRGMRAREAMVSVFESLPANADADAAARLLLSTTQGEFPVIDGGGLLRGFVTRDNLVQALRDKGGSTPVVDFMLRDIPVVSAESPLEDAFQMLQRRQTPIVAVNDAGGKFGGYIELQNLGELFLLRGSQTGK